MNSQYPMLDYLREVLDEHTLKLEGLNAGVIQAVWLIVLIHDVEDKYRQNGLL